MKQNASLDASFWINTCEGNIISHVPDYFRLYVPSTVAQEIRYPVDVLGITSFSSTLFDRWVASGEIIVQDPQSPVNWFQAGENAAIALAMEHNLFLLMDDANPYHRAKSAGLHVIGTTEFTILLFDQGIVTKQAAVNAIKQMNASKHQKRNGLAILEALARRKGT